MSSVDLSAYKDLYLQTAKKYITDMDTAVTLLQSDKTNKEAIETIHISAHSLKSQSQIMTYAQTGELSGTIEFLFRDVKIGKQTITDETLTHLKNALQKLSESVDAIEKTNTELDVSADVEQMKQFTNIT